MPRTTHSQRRKDPWKKQVKNQHRRTLCLHFLCPRCKTLFLLFSDEPDAKKVASQSEIDSALCTLNTNIDPITDTHSAQFPATHHCFPSLFQLLGLNWLPYRNKGSFVFLNINTFAACSYGRAEISFINHVFFVYLSVVLGPLR